MQRGGSITESHHSPESKARQRTSMSQGEGRVSAAHEKTVGKSKFTYNYMISLIISICIHLRASLISVMIPSLTTKGRTPYAAIHSRQPDLLPAA